MKYMKLGSKPDVFQTEGNSIRFVTTELATDIVITVGDIKFYLHKFPLLSKSSRLQTLVASTSEESNDEVDISDIPGGPAAFEVCAKFCYGMVVTLNAYNVVAARCAAEYLEMSEAVDKGNLVYKIDVFVSASLFRTWKDSIIVLQSTRSPQLQPWTENLKLVNHCVDAIAARASVDPAEVDWSYTYNRRKLPSENASDGWKQSAAVPRDWWVEDLCDLEVCLYRKVIVAIKAKGRTSGAVVGEALRAYACRRVLASLDHAVSNGLDCARHRAALDAVAELLPPEKGAVSCGLLLRLLRASCLLDSGEAYRGDLIKRIAAQLEKASVPDLLIPAAAVSSGGGGGDGAVYDVDVVAAILEEFLLQQHKVNGGDDQAKKLLQEDDDDDDNDMDGAAAADDVIASSKLVAVARLVDGYLSEIAKDPRLPLDKFVALAESMPHLSRPVHDTLYRAIDVYLKEHPGMSKGEKKRLCGLMDCRKLTAEASAHAVQNERLPLRVVVQVLFFEQVRQSAAAAGGPGTRALVLLPRDGDGASYGGSSRSATTTATMEDEQWGGGVVGAGAPTTSASASGGGGDASSLRSVSQLSGNNKSGGSGGGGDRKKAKGGAVAPAPGPARRVLGKLWSGNGKASSGENSGSDDTSESPAGSLTREETKSTPSRITRHSVS